MRKAFRHTGVLMMLGVVALGLVGAAYSLWYEKLDVQTTITTGTLNADWSIHNWNGTTFDSASTATALGQPIVHVATPSETILNGGVATVLSGGLLGGKTTSTSYNLFLQSNFPPGKPQPTCTASGGNSNTLVFTMSNLYPYAGCEFQLDLHSTGSVPFHIAITKQKIEQETFPGSGIWNDVTSTYNNFPWSRGFPSSDGLGNYTANTTQGKCFSFFNADWQGPIPGQINDSSGNPIQIHPSTDTVNNDLTCNFKLVLDENWKQNDGSYISDQNLSFRITTSYAAYQWNEQPSSSVLTSLP